MPPNEFEHGHAHGAGPARPSRGAEYGVAPPPPAYGAPPTGLERSYNSYDSYGGPGPYEYENHGYENHGHQQNGKQAYNKKGYLCYSSHITGRLSDCTNLFIDNVDCVSLHYIQT